MDLFLFFFSIVLIIFLFVYILNKHSKLNFLSPATTWIQLTPKWQTVINHRNGVSRQLNLMGMTTVESIQKWKSIKHVCNKNISGQNCNWVIWHHECDLCNTPVYFVCKKWENGEEGILFKLKLKIMQWTNFNTFLHVHKEILQKIVLISYFKSVFLHITTWKLLKRF